MAEQALIQVRVDKALKEEDSEEVIPFRPKGGQKIPLPKGAKAEKVPCKALTKRRKSDIL